MTGQFYFLNQFVFVIIISKKPATTSGKHLLQCSKITVFKGFFISKSPPSPFDPARADVL